MNVGLYQAASGMKANLERQQIVASNLARQNIPGARQLFAGLEVNSNTSLENKKKGVFLPEVITKHFPIHTKVQSDFRQGPISQTGDPLHFAVQGGSFFRIQDEKGNEFYTRNGSFYRATDGRVLTTDGDALLTDGGTPLSVASSSKFKVESDGAIKIDGTDAGKLGLAYFDHPETTLEDAGNGRYLPKNPDDVRPGMASRDELVQGSLEMGNTDTVTSAVSMMNILRVYEANQKALQAQDEASGRLVRTLSEKA